MCAFPSAKCQELSCCEGSAAHVSGLRNTQQQNITLRWRSVPLQVWKLSATDLCEIARASVLHSGFPHQVGNQFSGNHSETCVPFWQRCSLDAPPCMGTASETLLHYDSKPPDCCPCNWDFSNEVAKGCSAAASQTIY